MSRGWSKGGTDGEGQNRWRSRPGIQTSGGGKSSKGGERRKREKSLGIETQSLSGDIGSALRRVPSVARLSHVEPPELCWSHSNALEDGLHRGLVPSSGASDTAEPLCHHDQEP